SAAMQFADKFAGPLFPHIAEERKIVVLKKEDGYSQLFVKRAHLAHDFCGLAGAHYFPGGSAIEGMNGTERAGSRATATGQDRHNASPQHRLRFVIALRIWQLIKVFDQSARRREHDLAVIAIG